MSSKNITEKINAVIKSQIEAKRLAETERMEKQLERDVSDIGRVLEMIQKTLLFKKIPSQYGGKDRYLIVTEQMFLDDYTGEPENKFSSKGIIFTSEEDLLKYYNPIVKVNGHRYYDVRNFIYVYSNDIDACKDRLETVFKKLHEVEDQYKNLMESFPSMQKMIMEWAEKHQGE